MHVFILIRNSGKHKNICHLVVRLNVTDVSE
jgi:hypothetical protein